MGKKALGLDEVALAVSGSIALVALALGTTVSGTTGDIISQQTLQREPLRRLGSSFQAKSAFAHWEPSCSMVIRNLRKGSRTLTPHRMQ